MRLLFYLMALLAGFFLCSCDLDQKGSSKVLLPSAKGAPGEIVMVIDSATYEGPVGDQIKSTFNSQVKWLSRPESYFTLRVVEPDELNSVLRSSRNLLYVTVLNDKSRGNRLLKRNFTKESLTQIRENPSIFMFSKEDEFAKGQKVLHIFALDEASLAKKIAENEEKLRDFFNELEYKRAHEKVYKGGREKGISNFIEKNYDCSIALPSGYEIAIKNDQFIWTRILDLQVDRNIFITYVDYHSPEQFKKEQLISFRDSVLAENIFGDPENPDSFMTTEKDNFPIYHKEVNFNGKYAVQMRGMWKTNNLSMGGTFVSYALVDEKQNRFYYIEGFLYSPGKKQREHMRDLDVILRTFDTRVKN